MTDQIWSTISEIIPNKMYLTGLKGLENTEQVKTLKIDIVISVTDFIPFKYSGIPKQYLNIKFVHYYAEDKEEFNLSQYFEQFIELVNNSQNKKILVHCLVGMSRSASIVGAYMLYKNIVLNGNLKYDVEEMFKELKECREWIDPNNGFVLQLKNFRNNLI